MPRISGIDIPANKKVYVSLTYVYGIGDAVAMKILKEAGIDPNTRAKNLTDEQVSKINSIIDKQYTVEGTLKRSISQNIQRLRDIQCYRGFRHKRGLPVRGQRTRSNARTRKGPRKTVAGKKIAKTTT